MKLKIFLNSGRSFYLQRLTKLFSIAFFLFVNLSVWSQINVGDTDDFDGDGILNNTDLDADNDGILNIDECPTEELDGDSGSAWTVLYAADTTIDPTVGSGGTRIGATAGDLAVGDVVIKTAYYTCLLYTSPSPRDA